MTDKEVLAQSIARIEQLNAELDALRESFDKYQADTEGLFVENAAAIAREMLELARFEGPEHAIAYAHAALSQVPVFPEDHAIDVTRITPSLTLITELAS